MIGWVWLIGVFVCWIPFAIALIGTLGGNLDSEDYMFGTIFGGLISLVWPITLIVYGVSRLVRRSVEAQEEADR